MFREYEYRCCDCGTCFNQDSRKANKHHSVTGHTVAYQAITDLLTLRKIIREMQYELEIAKTELRVHQK